MAVQSLGATTWACGVAEPSTALPAWAGSSSFVSGVGEKAHYHTTDPCEQPTSDPANDIGTSKLRSWLILFNGTAGSCMPSDWVPRDEVDVLICGGQ